MKVVKSLGFYFVLFFLFLTPLVVSILPFVIQSLNTPPDRVFMGLHRWSEDYYGYLHTINEGLMGHLMTVNKITNQEHVPTFVHSEYAFLGLIGKVFGLNAPLTYHLSRLVLGGVFLISSFYFLLTVFTLARVKKPFCSTRVAFFLAFFVGSFPNSLDWLVELDATRRSTILPHYLMGSILMLVIFTLFLKNKKIVSLNSLFLILASFLLAFVHPVDFALTVSILTFYSFLTKSWRTLVFLLPGLIPILYFRYVFTLPFYRFIAQHGSTTAYNIPILDFAFAIGPVLILASYFFLLNFKKLTTNSQLLMFSLLIIQTFFFFAGYQILNFDRLRALHAPFFIPLSFFATLFLLKLEKKIKILFLILNTKYLILIIIFLITLPLSFQSIKKQIYEVSDFQSFSSFTYPSKKVYEAFMFLKNNTPENSLITTGYEARFLLPSVAGNKVAFGSNFEKDPEYQRDMDKVTKIYQGTLTGDDLEKFLKENNIKYVYWGYQEKSYGGDLTQEKFLSKIFDNGEVVIFKVYHVQ